MGTRLIAVVVLWAYICPGVAAVQRAEIFIASPATPLQGIEHLQAQGVAVTVYDLSARKSLEAELSQGLPGDPRLAQVMVRERVLRLSEPMKQALIDAHQGELNARQYRIRQVPAVVFDGRYLVYGTSDLTEALQTYRREGGATR